MYFYQFINYLNNKRMNLNELNLNDFSHGGNRTRLKHQLVNQFHF
jgi:hypothetical protein